MNRHISGEHHKHETQGPEQKGTGKGEHNGGPHKHRKGAEPLTAQDPTNRLMKRDSILLREILHGLIESDVTDTREGRRGIEQQNRLLPPRRIPEILTLRDETIL